MMPDDDDDDDDDPMILNIRAKYHTSERTIVPWTVIFFYYFEKYVLKIHPKCRQHWLPFSVCWKKINMFGSRILGKPESEILC